MRVALLAPSVRGVMGQYLEALAEPLSELVELNLFVPNHYVSGKDQATLHHFPTGANKAQALIRLLNPWAAHKLWQQIKQLRPDVLHIFNGEGYPWSILLAQWAKRAGLPLVVTVHDPDPHPGNLWEALNARLRTRTLELAGAIHIHSPQFIPTMQKLGFATAEIKIIPHGSIAHQFTRHRQEGIPKEPLVLFFGRLEAYKGLDVLVEAAELLDGLKVAIAGPGVLPEQLAARIMDNPGRFELHNSFLSDQEVAHLFQRASVCVLPYKQVTQSSLPMLAAGFGVPTVASALGGFLEDVPRVNGILVPPANPSALAEGIKKAVKRQAHYPQELEFAQLAHSFADMYGELMLKKRKF